MEELKKKIDKEVELLTKQRDKEEDETVREFYLGKIIAYLEMRGLIGTMEKEIKA